MAPLQTSKRLRRKDAARSKARNSRPLADSVLRLVWRENQISRAEIARTLDLSRSTVSDIVSLWLKRGLVAEVGTGPSSGGRRPIVLEFQDNACVILGIEMGATHLAVALTNLRGEILSWEQRTHATRDDPEGTRKLMLELCQACMRARPGNAAHLVGICVAVPSPVDPASPDELSEVVLPSWQGQGGFEVLGDHYGVPLWIDNDANLGALAEGWWGAGRGVDDFAYIKIGMGVGAGYMLGGKIYRGAKGVAGEIGHLVIDPYGGAPCVCGLRGCLVTLVGAPALVKQAREGLPKYPDSCLANGELSVDVLHTAALDGDPLAVQIAEEAAEHLGIAVAGMVNLMNPARVILGGGLVRLGELLVRPMRETLEKRTLVGSMNPANIVLSTLGPRSVAIGAATLVLQSALARPTHFPPARTAAEVL